ncbi:TetR/AcrR family transcriptional regulator [Psychrobium sp. MM17-31]|uniref:TetR/AcrR family transcriptional regulator n=1 Tax=Psychrobium sp. MM17-31 TaxID=2917758 RepID=UPI001EF4128C|nr:TetR/AcrR family transcriptional regulator [Psychrobium sp. MM17-31]MCG7532735.1 TetR/AcrR family transcriptional regulator [Psychrobium sp. MM17-31]
MNTDTSYKPRKRPSQARSSVTYNAILESAARVLVEAGVESTTTNKIAETAGTSIGTLYEYFPSKEAIFAELIRKLDQQMADSVISVFSTMTIVKPAQLIEAIVRARVKEAVSFPELDKLLRALVPAHLFKLQMKNTHSRFYDGMKQFVDSNPTIVRVRNVDKSIELGTLVVESTIRAIAANTPERLHDEDFIQELIDLMCRYILDDQSYCP